MIDEIFVRNIGIIVIAATIFALCARGVSLPTIVAYLAAGLFLGPLTGLIEISDAIHLIAETGIVLLLFLVGLELSFGKIRGVGLVALLAGGAQIVLTTLGGFGLSYALGFALLPALILGIALTFSSTVIVVKLLVDAQASDKPYGQIAIGILLVQDLFVVILLTLLSGLGGSGEAIEMAAVGRGLAVAFGGMAVLLCAVLAASRWLLPKPFTWAARSPETFFIWSLCWCFLVVAVTHLLHLSPEIGAFVAGISLAQLPYHRDLQRRVQPLMSFFIAVFFVVLGIEMQLDLSLAFWLQGMALAIFVVVGKFLIIMFIVARLGYAERTACFSALFLTQVSEFSFIVMALVVEAGFVGGEAGALLGLVGLLSITVSTIAIGFRESLYEKMRQLGLLGIFRARGEAGREREGEGEQGKILANHVIVVGMNGLGRELVKRLRRRGETVVAIDVDPLKLSGLDCVKLLGDAQSAALLAEAHLAEAKVLISALHIETTNDLLAFRCKQAGVRSAIHAVDLTAVDHLLEMDVSYLIAPNVDGMKRQTSELERRGFLKR